MFPQWALLASWPQESFMPVYECVGMIDLEEGGCCSGCF